MKLMPSKFRGRCFVCNGPIEVGASIWFDGDADKGRRTRHEACSTESAADAAVPPPSPAPAPAAPPIVPAAAGAAMLHPHLNIVRFDSPAELRSWALVDPPSRLKASPERLVSEREWFGGGSMLDHLNRSITGDDSNVAAAEALISQFGNVIVTPMMQEHADVCGCYPVVPEVLAGEPECMRIPTLTECETAPLRIIVDLTTSGGITEKQIRERGIAVLALVLALSAVRAVSLEVCAALDGKATSASKKDQFSLCAVRLNTAPLDLSTACYILTSPGYHRAILYRVLEAAYKANGGWPKLEGVQYGHAHAPEAVKRLTAYLADGDEEVLFLPALSMYSDGKDDPGAWVKRMYDRYAPGSELSD